MTALQIKDLADAGSIDGTELAEIQIAAGGSGSSKRTTLASIASLIKWGMISGALSDQADLQAALDALVPLAKLAVANGVATLDSSGKLDGSQIPAALLGSVSYQGTWDASSGSAPSSTPSKGQYWVVSVAGSTSLGGITDWKVGDWAIYDTAWDKVDNTDGVVSVAGLTGIITAAALRTALALATVATSGAYVDLSGLPTLGTAAAADFAAMPFINLMPDSGMFGGIVDPLSGVLLPSAFQNTGPFIVTYNGSTITNDGSKFIHNNSTNGGTAGALTSTVVALLSAMGRTGNNARYGNEFFVAQLNAGTGTGGSISTPDGTLYLMTGGSAAFASAENYETFVGWVRVRPGSNPFYVQKIGKLYIDHVEVTGATYKFADNTFHHVRAIVQMAAGYDGGFPHFYSTSGTVIDIAVPGFFHGLVDPGLHTAPLKTINAVSGGQPAPMPLAGGAFGGPAAPASYTLTTLPSAATYSGYLIRVSNATGGPALCMSDGTNWINIRTGSAVS